jgi:hypothetical protein
VGGTQRIVVGFRGLFGEEPAKQTERSCKAWEFSRSQAQEREAQKDGNAIQPVTKDEEPGSHEFRQVMPLVPPKSMRRNYALEASEWLLWCHENRWRCMPHGPPRLGVFAAVFQ